MLNYEYKFPKTLAEFKTFVKKHQFNVDKIDDKICSSIIEKINSGNYIFSDDEISVMRNISKIGDVCTCDTDHRIGKDNKTCAFSRI